MGNIVQSGGYKVISATGNVTPIQGDLVGIWVSSASATPTITIYDSALKSDQDPIVLATFTPVAATAFNFFDGLYLSRGMYVVIGGTVSATFGFD